MKVRAMFTRRFASWAPCFVRYSVRTGMKADDMEPSAKSSLRRLGILKATKNVSESPVAPKYLARIMSLT